MNRIRPWLFQHLVAIACPATLLAFSDGPPIARTGAAVDGGIDCTACHRSFAPANSDPRGRISIQASPYVPGVKQTVKVVLEHPDGARWGFQLIARLVSDESKQAGAFTASSDIRVVCAPDTRNAPCDGEREFATHRRVATQAGTVGMGTFDVEWTPPASDVGSVIFYAAGNVADNSGSNAGDRIFTTNTRISAACAFTGRPTITSVVDGGSFQPGISQNSMITLFGSGFAPTGTSRVAARADFVDGKFPKELSCVAVEVAGQRAAVSFVSGTQINAQAPTISSLGPVEVRVIANPGRPNEIRGDARGGVQLQRYSPAFFTFFSNGRNIAAQHTNFDLLADPSVVSGARPIAPGGVALLYGTGFGMTEPAWQAGDIPDRLSRLRDTFSITVGGVTLRPEDILYAGLSPGSISGLYQFNIRIPATTSDGDIPVVVEIGGLRTATATIRVRR